MRSLDLARLVVSGRLRTLSSGWARAGAWTAVLVCAAVLAGASAAGDVLRWALSPQVRDTAGGLFVRVLTNGWLGDGFVKATTLLLVAVLAGTVSQAVVPPTAPSLLSDQQRAAVRWTVASRFVESWVASCVSVIPVMELAGLTAAASLVSMDAGTHARATLVAWGAWLVVSAAGQALTWWVSAARRAGARHTGAWAAAACGVLGGLVVVTWGHAKTLWGAAGAFEAAMNRAPLLAVLAVELVAVVGFGWLGLRGCARSSRLPASVRSRAGRTSRPLPTGAWSATLAAVSRSAWRNRQVRTPVGALWLMVASLAAAVGPTRPVVAITCLGLPVTWALAFSRNFLAVTGPAGCWLASTPAGAERIQRAGSVLAATGGLMLPVSAWLPALLVGRMDPASVGSVLAIATCVGALTAASSVLYAVRHPEPVDATGRVPLLSAGRTASGTVRLAVPTLVGYVAATGGQVLFDSTTQPRPLAVLVGVGSCLVLAGALWWLTARTWADPAERSSALAVAGAIG